MHRTRTTARRTDETPLVDVVVVGGVVVVEIQYETGVARTTEERRKSIVIDRVCRVVVELDRQSFESITHHQQHQQQQQQYEL
jgi:helix-turn-helix protein